MTWAEFLKKIEDHDQLAVVGPLLNHAHQPDMATVYVDGGSNFREGGGWAAKTADTSAFPVVSVGDGDSASGKMDEILPAEKDYSDLAFVLRSLPATIRTVHMLGFWGKRRDHELANLGEVHHFLRTRAHRTLVHLHGSEQTVVALSHGQLTLQIIGIFSVMVFEPEPVHISGACSYKLSGDVTLPPASSIGLSNRGNGMVTIESEKPCFIFLNS